MRFTFVRAIWAIFHKDIAVWWSNKRNIVVTVLPVLSLLLIQWLGAVAVGRSQVALVTLDHGPKGRQMQQIFQHSDAFSIMDATPSQAQTLLQELQVAAVITIPTDFTQHFAAHEPSHISVTINNLDADFTDDIRRAVPDALTQFY